MIRLWIILSFFVVPSSFAAQMTFVNASAKPVLFILDFGSTSHAFRVPAHTVREETADYDYPSFSLRVYKMDNAWGYTDFGLTNPYTSIPQAINSTKHYEFWVMPSDDGSVTYCYFTSLPLRPASDAAVLLEPLAHLWALAIASFIIGSCWIGYRFYHR